MRFNKRFKFKKWNQIISVLALLLVAIIIGGGKLGNSNWMSIFKGQEISEVMSFSENPDSDMSVHFLDVGKADCIYVKFKDHNILIDAADKLPNELVVDYLKKQGVSKIDLAVVSHPHRDHIGQMTQVINEFEIGKFIEPEIPENLIPTGATYEKMLKALKEKEVNCEFAKAGQNFDIDNLKIEVLGPVNPGKDLNNNSIVLKMTYKNISFLFMGDAEKTEEAEIIDAGYNVKANVLKVGHHGSKTSSSENFIKKVSPEYSVICVGPDRSNLPKEEILERIKKYCQNIYRTDLKGNVIISTDGEKINVKTKEMI